MNLGEEFEEQIVRELREGLEEIVEVPAPMENFEEQLDEMIDTAEGILENYADKFDAVFEVLGKSAPKDPMDMDRTRMNRAAAILLEEKFDELDDLRELSRDELQEELWNECPACNGTGTYKGLNEIEDPCENCKGSKQVFALEPSENSVLSEDGDSLLDVCQPDDSVVCAVD